MANLNALLDDLTTIRAQVPASYQAVGNLARHPEFARQIIGVMEVPGTRGNTVRHMAAALLQMEKPGVTRRLKDMIVDDNVRYNTRMDIISAMGNSGQREFVPVLSKAARAEPEPYVRDTMLAGMIQLLDMDNRNAVMISGTARKIAADMTAITAAAPEHLQPRAVLAILGSREALQDIGQALLGTYAELKPSPNRTLQISVLSSWLAQTGQPAARYYLQEAKNNSNLTIRKNPFTEDDLFASRTGNPLSPEQLARAQEYRALTYIERALEKLEQEIVFSPGLPPGLSRPLRKPKDPAPG